MLLKKYREHAGLSQAELAAQAGLSPSTISRVEKGERSPPRRRGQVLALAKALGLDQENTDLLLSAAGLAPSTAPELALHPRDETLYRIAREIELLRNDPQVTPAQVRFVEESLLLLLRGARAALGEADLTVVPIGVPTARPLSEEERYLDDLLGDCIAGRLPGNSIPFAVLAAVARSPRWELKRRLSEALPALLKIDVDRTLTLMHTLRDDPPDPEWRTDIRRRVVEATPVLWRIRPQATRSLLQWRDGDEVYAALATLDALAEIDNPDLTVQVRADILKHVVESQREAITLYARLLDLCAADPDAALREIGRQLDETDRLKRICIARTLPRLLSSRPAETLQKMRYFLRRKEGKPAEHQNVRRAVARDLQRLIALLEGPYEETALALLRALAGDRDVHIRRAICDALPEIIAHRQTVALELIAEYLLPDRDRFVRERTWSALLKLMNAGLEKAEELCAQMIELA